MHDTGSDRQQKHAVATMSRGLRSHRSLQMGSDDGFTSKAVHDKHRIQILSRNDAHFMRRGNHFTNSLRTHLFCIINVLIAECMISQEMRDMKKFIEKVLKP